ncbi:hypothetical protein NDU88_000419 [Pleurodeles waltl]|uniref:Uncharacterized protein n=1 Tax=Pleurodeles waltl TaxID=8319 RepID=A0AAV7LUM1_PLEWA|nr:hypothetical protein NDU88_000419 [Pleurodeles waltl]
MGTSHLGAAKLAFERTSALVRQLKDTSVIGSAAGRIQAQGLALGHKLPSDRSCHGRGGQRKDGQLPGFTLSAHCPGARPRNSACQPGTQCPLCPQPRDKAPAGGGQWASVHQCENNRLQRMSHVYGSVCPKPAVPSPWTRASAVPKGLKKKHSLLCQRARGLRHHSARQPGKGAIAAVHKSCAQESGKGAIAEVHKSLEGEKSLLYTRA